MRRLLISSTFLTTRGDAGLRGLWIPASDDALRGLQPWMRREFRVSRTWKGSHRRAQIDALKWPESLGKMLWLEWQLRIKTGFRARHAEEGSTGGPAVGAGSVARGVRCS